MSALDVRQIGEVGLKKGRAPAVKQELRILIAEKAFDEAVARGEKDGTREVGGVLVGELLRDDAGPFLRVDATIDALHADEKGAELTFTHATWEHINKEMDSTHADRKIVGWYHTHPGFGIFLSDRDEFIHSSFFDQPFQIALVYDPKSREHGVFAWHEGRPTRCRRYWIGEREHTWDGTRAAEKKEEAPAEAAGGSPSKAPRPKDAEAKTAARDQDERPGDWKSMLATGALMAHGLSEAVGLTHYKADPRVPDEALFEKGYNRVYDTLEMEKNLNAIDEFGRGELDKLDPNEPWSSELICRQLGKALADMGESPGILRSAYLHKVPVFVPAFTDSEMGLDVATWQLRKLQAKHGGGAKFDVWKHAAPPAYNPFLDLLSYARLVTTKKHLGIFTIGGGVPRNWAQQVAPFYDIVEHRLGLELEHPRFRYGVRICPEPVQWGGL